MLGFLLWLPPEPLLMPSLADPRAPVSHVSTRFGDERLDAGLGTAVPIVQYKDVQVHLVGGAWMSFRNDGPLTYALLSFDGTFGVPVQVAYESWRFEAGWRHISAHLADGTRMNGPELRIPIAYSREVIWTRAAYPLGPVQPWLGVSYLGRSTPALKPWALQAGARAEWRFLFAEVDLQIAAEDPDVAVGVVLGVQRERRVHLGLRAYRGPDRRGQFLGEDDAWVGLALLLDPR